MPKIRVELNVGDDCNDCDWRIFGYSSDGKKAWECRLFDKCPDGSRLPECIAAEVREDPKQRKNTDDDVVWSNDYENSRIDPLDGSDPFMYWWEDMRPKEVRELVVEAYKRGMKRSKSKQIQQNLHEEPKPEDRRCGTCGWYEEFGKDAKADQIENSFEEYDGFRKFNLASADPGRGVYEDEGTDCDGWKARKKS